jgi:hypothetical protein
MPNAVQSSSGVKPIWLFYSSDLNVPDLDIYALQSSGISPVDDLLVAGAVASSNLGTSWEYPGGFKSVGQSAIVTVTVSIADIGDNVENAVVTLTISNTTTAYTAIQKSFIGPGNTMNFYFYWNTTNAKPARYGLTVSLALVAGQTYGNSFDSSLRLSNQMHILPLGDVNQDGDVTIADFSVFAYDYGFTSSCNCSRYNLYADIQGNGMITIVDVGVAQHNYGIFA